MFHPPAVVAELQMQVTHILYLHNLFMLLTFCVNQFIILWIWFVVYDTATESKFVVQVLVVFEFFFLKVYSFITFVYLLADSTVQIDICFGYTDFQLGYIFFVFSNSIFVIINLFSVEIKNLIKQTFG